MSTDKLPPAPPPSAATKSMKANRSSGTKPELALRRELFRLGLRYRVGIQIRLASRKVRPDVVFPKRKVAIFLDGCFWHGCPLHGRMPTDPTGYWRAKIGRNRDRDAADMRELEAAGWLAVRIWEHEVASEAAARVKNLVSCR
ncbi:very short patch repair endonuclease [Micromonospora sp. NBC_00821]|uniref:very short patch repair endonuclease n=1 Tax=Micromonospora sp. NBC_00821 TaxID=2975977 RepID=UPI002ED03891|nr:very short patch repair endonuclease [Micromonospora sp. NBC_00821]